MSPLHPSFVNFDLGLLIADDGGRIAGLWLRGDNTVKSESYVQHESFY